MYDAIIFTDVTDTVLIFKAIGAYKCANMLRQNGYTCLVIDHLHGFNSSELKLILDKTISDRTLFVGFSTTFTMDTSTATTSEQGVAYKPMRDSFFPQGKEVEDEVIDHLKSLNKNCKVVLGGTSAHANISNKNVNYSVMGYGEASVLMLANHLKYSTPLEYSYKNIFGVVVVDNKTAAGYDFVNNTFSWDPMDVIGTKVLPIEIARGCIFKCKFCSYPLNGKENLDFIRHVDNLYQELQTNYDRFNVTSFIILDDTFNDNEPKLDILLAAIKRLSFQPKFWAYNRLDLVATNYNLMDKLYDIGLRGMFFGIETLNKRTGLIIGKGYDRSKQINTLQKIRHRYGNDILLHGSFILGLPEESVESMNLTFESLMNETIPLHSFQFNALQLYKNDKVAFNSEIGKNYTEYGYINSDPESTDIKVNWKNDYLNYQIASQMMTDFNRLGKESDRMHLANQVAFSLKNYSLDDEYLHNVKFKEVDWYEITKKKYNFIDMYKIELFKQLG